jgi:hypothetical protein
MAADDVRIEYHLTPGGWVRGTRRLFSQVTGAEVPRPAEAVATFEHREYDSSSFGPTSFSVKETWRRSGASDALLRDLLEHHGSPEQGNWAGTKPWKNLARQYKG